MIIGMGIDLVYIPKFSENLKSSTFLEKVFTQEEIQYCLHYKKSDERFAGKFAAKEAFMKSIASGLKQEVWFSQIQIHNRDSGAPFITCSGEALKILSQLSVKTIHVSISHSQEIAVAVVILEG